MRILVVEDEHRIAQTLKKGLEQERFAVDIVYDGSEGLDMALSENYDLYILDLMLPGVDGITLCRKIRENGIHTPILMLTAKSQVQDKVTGLDSGADDYLTKPFSFEELLARIRALIRRPQTRVDTIVSVKDLSLNPKTYVVERSGKRIDVSSREFALLEYLMRNTGVVLTKEQIISHVWNYDADILPNTIEVYIRNLRNKVGRDLIQTMRGFGYKMGD
jgi:two-component system, OmpR family, response regulator